MSRYKYYTTAFKSKGIIELLTQIVTDYYYNKKIFKGYNFSNNAGYGFADAYKTTAEVYDKSMGKDGHLNSPSSSYYIFKCFGYIRLKPKDVVLLDVGCGNGKILVSGIYKGFKKVYGVDLDSTGLKAAKENCAKAANSFTSTTYEIIKADAAKYDIPSDVNVIFLYNPFGYTTLKQVIENTEASYRASTREIYLLYYSPEFSKAVEQSGMWQCIHQHKIKSGRTDFKIYKLTDKKE